MLRERKAEKLILEENGTNEDRANFRQMLASKREVALNPPFGGAGVNTCSGGWVDGVDGKGQSPPEGGSSNFCTAFWQRFHLQVGQDQGCRTCLMVILLSLLNIIQTHVTLPDV